MKKLTSIFFVSALILMLIFSSCGVKNIIMPPELPKYFSSGIIVKYKDKELKATLDRSTDEVTTVTVSEPETLNGVTLRFEGSDCTFSYKSLSFNVDLSKLSETAACKKLVTYLKTVAENGDLNAEKGDSAWTYTFTDAEGAVVTLVQNADTGFFESLSAADYDLFVTFVDFTEH